VDIDAPVAAFEAVAAEHPVFRVTPAGSMGDTAPMNTEPDAPSDRDAPPARDFDPHLEAIRAAPADGGRIELIVVRPAVDERTVVTEVMLDVVEGVVGDGWRVRGSSRTADGSANPEAQVTIMSTRVLAAIEPDTSRWPLAGDQLLADADLSTENLPPGTRLAIGDAVLEVSEAPHTGGAKFRARFGSDALRWINSPLGRELRMRGINTRVVRGGAVRVGDELRRA
jgi:MOSC domain-containing protein YiiM